MEIDMAMANLQLMVIIKFSLMAILKTINMLMAKLI
jgi:hypothetical protein